MDVEEEEGVVVYLEERGRCVSPQFVKQDEVSEEKEGALSWLPVKVLESDWASSGAEVITIAWRIMVACLAFMVTQWAPTWVWSRLWSECLDGDEKEETRLAVGENIALVSLRKRRVIAYSLDPAGPKVLWTKESSERATIDSEGRILIAQGKQLLLVAGTEGRTRHLVSLDSKCIFLNREICITVRGQILVLSSLEDIRSRIGAIGYVRQLNDDRIELEGYAAYFVLERKGRGWQCGPRRSVARNEAQSRRALLELLDATPIVPILSSMKAIAATLRRVGLIRSISTKDEFFSHGQQDVPWRNSTLRLENGVLSLLNCETKEETPVEVQTGEQSFAALAVHKEQEIVLALSDGSLRVCRPAAADGLVAKAARKGSLEAALRESRRLGLESQLTARRCIWEKFGSLEALTGDADQAALHWIAQAAAQDHRPEAHRLGMTALERVAAEDKEDTRQLLQRAIERSRLYSEIQTVLDMNSPSSSSSVVGNAVESRFAGLLQAPLPWTWKAVRDAETETEIWYALAKFGIVLDSVLVPDDPDTWLDSVPETAEIPDAVLSKCSVEAIAKRVRGIDARCGQIVLAERVCRHRSGLEPLHRNCWQLARLATHREARTVFAKISLEEWENFAIAKQLTSVLDLGEALALELLPAMLPPQQHALSQNLEALADACSRSYDKKKNEVRARTALRLLAVLPASDARWRCYLKIIVESGVDDNESTMSWSEPTDAALCARLSAVRNRLRLKKVLRESYKGLELGGLLQANSSTLRRQLCEALGVRHDSDDARLIRLLLEARDTKSSDRAFVLDVASLSDDVIWPATEKARLGALAVAVATRRAVKLDLITTDLRQLDDEVVLSEVNYDDLRACDKWLRRSGSTAAAVRCQLLGLSMLFGDDARGNSCSAPENISAAALRAWELTSKAVGTNAGMDDLRPAMDESSLVYDLRDWASDIVAKEILGQGMYKRLRDAWEDTEVPLWRRRSVVGAVLAACGSQEKGLWAAWCAAEAACIDFEACSGRIESAARGATSIARFVLHLQTEGEGADLASALCIEAALRVATTSPDRDLRCYVAAVALRAARPSSSPKRYAELVAIASESSTSLNSAENALRAYREREAVALLVGARVQPEVAAALFAARDDEFADGEIDSPDATLVTHLISLGFSKNGATRAAAACKNSTDLAVRWCADHCADAEFDQPLPESHHNRHPPGARLRAARACFLYLRLSKAPAELVESARERIRYLMTSDVAPATKMALHSDGLTFLERRWDRALSVPDDEARSLLGLKTSKAALAVAEAGVAGVSSLPTTQRVISVSAPHDAVALRDAIESLDSETLADLARRRYAATTRASHMELACRFLAEHLGAGHPETRKAQVHALLLRRLVQALGRSHRLGLEASINAKALCGDIFSSSDSVDNGDARENVAKAADADTAMAMARLVPKLRGGVQPSEVWPMALSTELRAAFSSDTDSLSLTQRSSLRTLAARQEQKSEQIILREVLEALPTPQRAEPVLTQRLGLEARAADECLRALAAVRATPLELREAAKAVVLGGGDVHSLGRGLASELEAIEVRAILIGLNVPNDNILDSVYKEAGAAAARSGPESVQALVALAEKVPLAAEAVRSGVGSVLEENPSTAAELATIVADEQRAKVFAVRDLVRRGWPQLDIHELSGLLPRLFAEDINAERADLIWQVLALLEEEPLLDPSALLLKTLFYSSDSDAAVCSSLYGASWLELCRRAPNFGVLAARGCPCHSVDIQAESDFFHAKIETDRTSALLFGLSSPNPSLRLQAAACLDNHDSFFVPALRRSGAWRPLLRDNMALLRIACSFSDQSTNTMIDSPIAAATACIVAAASFPEILIAIDLLSNALGVHCELRTVDTAVFTSEYFFASENDPKYLDGLFLDDGESWATLRSSARAALIQYNVI